MNLFQSNSDVENFIIIMILFAMFVSGIAPLKNYNKVEKGFKFDRNFSGALKGIACVLILTGHYSQMFYGQVHGCLSWYVAQISANVALVWFMFISGYGLTKSKCNISNHFTACILRCSKVLFPLLFVMLVSFGVYLVLPSWHYSVNEANKLVIPEEMLMMQNIADLNWRIILFSPVKWYWYVWCILFYYVLFYLSSYLAQQTKWNHTGILMILLICYYFTAYTLLGSLLAHYYRLTWAFFFGHLLAARTEISRRVFVGGVMLGLASFANEGRYMCISFFIAIITIIGIGWLNKKYSFRGRILLNMGILSYFFYLLHRRVCWPIACTFGIHDLIIWIFLTLLMTIFVHKVYHKISIPYNRGK